MVLTRPIPLSTLVFALVLLAVPGHRSVAGAQVTEKPIRIENGFLQIGVDPGGGRLMEFMDSRTGQHFVVAGADQAGLWELNLLPGHEVELLRPAQAGTFRWERGQDNEPALQLIWEDFGLQSAPYLRVRALIRLQEAAPMSEWRMVIEEPGTLGIETVRFPRVLNIARLGDQEELAVPRWMGELATDPRDLLAGADGEGRRLEWFYPGRLSLQALALYQRNGPGFYAASDDTAAYRKAFAIWGDGRGSISFEILTPLEDPGARRDRRVLPYGALLGTFEGDWITAAERYRAWGTQQRWARESRLKRGLVPAWLLETGFWVWNRGRSPGVLPPAVALQRELGLPVRVFWHWWHAGPYDTSFPEYLPPREGTEPFKRALREAQAAGVRGIVYMNQRLWCTTTGSWTEQGAERFAVKNRDGKVPEEVYNIFDPQPCAPMDITTQFWRDKYAGLSETMIQEYEVDGIYMDQAVSSLICYDPSHGHPVGGGNYWMTGFRALTEDIRRRSAGRPQAILAGEGGGETWLPELDLFLTLRVSRERFAAPDDGWEVIPFFQAVYHAYGLTYGSYSSLTFPPYDDLWPAEFAPEEPLKLLDRKYRRQFYLEQARTFVWGMQPTIANFLPSHSQQRPEEVEYMMRLARIRSHALDYLLYGTFLRPPKLNVPDIDVEISRISIYAARRGGETSWQRRFPAALAGAWQAEDGSLAIPVASIADERLSVSFSVDPAAYGLTPGGLMYRIDENGRELIGEFGADPIPITLELPPRGAYILELKAAP